MNLFSFSLSLALATLAFTNISFASNCGASVFGDGISVESPATIEIMTVEASFPDQDLHSKINEKFGEDGVHGPHIAIANALSRGREAVKDAARSFSNVKQKKLAKLLKEFASKDSRALYIFELGRLSRGKELDPSAIIDTYSATPKDKYKMLDLINAYGAGYLHEQAWKFIERNLDSLDNAEALAEDAHQHESVVKLLAELGKNKYTTYLFLLGQYYEIFLINDSDQQE